MLDKKHRNTLILVASLLVLLLSCFYFFLGIHIQETGKMPDIGEVFRKNNDLRRKLDGSLSWVDVDHTSKLYPGDKVFTGAESLAQLNLLDLAEIGMNSSTLLRIDPKIDPGAVGEMALQGGLGFFTTKLSKNLTKTTIKLKHSTLEMNGRGSEMHVNGFEDKTMVAAIGGNITFKTFGQDGKSGSRTLAANQLLGMNRAGASTVIDLPTKLIAPTVAEELVLMPMVPVTFKWQVLNPNVNVSLQLSKTPTFEKVFFKKDVTKLSEDQVLIDKAEEGVVYWRIVEEGRAEYFHAQQFAYQPLYPPTIYEPGVRQNYPDPKPEGPELSWEKRFDFEYEGEIQQLSGGIQGAQKFKGPHPSYLTKNLVAGHYQVKVRAGKNQLVTDWTAWQPFTVGPVDREGIELISPLDMATATFLFPQREIKFEWAGGGSHAQIQIANDDQFKDVVMEAITDKHEFNWKPVKEGRYYWHVKSSPKAKTGIVRSVIVVEPKLTLLTPKNKIGYIFRDQGYQDIHFTWENVSLDDRYVLEIAGSPDFSNVFERTPLDKPEYDVKFPKRNTTIYWRVKTGFQTSEARSFRIYPAPDLTAPVLDSVVVAIQEDTTIFGGTMERNPTQLGPDFVEIFLPSVEKAASFRVEIMRDISGKNIVISKTLNAPLFRWNNPTPGNYYWRVSYEDSEGNRSPNSGVASLTILPKASTTEENPFSKMPY